MMKKLLIVAALFSTLSHAQVRSNSEISLTANLMAASCEIARKHVSVDTALDVAHKNVKGLSVERIDYFVNKGYVFAVSYPDVSCNQIFITVIDTLVGAKS